MANDNNLKPIRSVREAREKGKKGGIASGKSRAVRKTFKETINGELDDKTMKQLIKAMINQAKNGNTKAFEILRDTVGEKPIEKQEIKEITSEWFK